MLREAQAGNMLPLSSKYICIPRPNCFRLLVHAAWAAFWRALLKLGKSMAARIAMMAMTTSSSISVKAQREYRVCPRLAREKSLLAFFMFGVTINYITESAELKRKSQLAIKRRTEN